MPDSEDKFYGCMDGACIIQRPKGMHTNGGCKCLSELHIRFRPRIRAGIMRLREQRNVLRGRLLSIVENLGLRQCKRCGHYHQDGHRCYECGHDPSDD